MFFKIAALKHFAIFRGKYLGWCLFLIKLQASSFPIKTGKFFKNSFFHKIAPVAASEKIHKSQENISDGGVIDLSF